MKKTNKKSEILYFRKLDLSYGSIAKIMGVSKQYVHSVCKTIKTNKKTNCQKCKNKRTEKITIIKNGHFCRKCKSITF